MQVKTWSLKLIMGFLIVAGFGIWIGWKLTQHYTQQKFRLKPPNYEFVIPTGFQQSLKPPQSQLITPFEFDKVFKTAKKLYQADLKGKSGQKGQARLIIKGKTNYLGVNLTGLTPPAKGFFYQVWLFDDKQRILPIERLIYDDKNQSGIVYIKTFQDLSPFSGVIVSLEPEAPLQKPSQIIAQGKIVAINQ